VSVQSVWRKQPKKLGEVRGAVINDKAASVVGARVKLVPMDGKPLSTSLPQALTRTAGDFSIKNLPYGQYRIFATKESEGYVNTSFAFYSNNEYTTVTVQATNPVVSVTLKIGPPGGVISGTVTDAATKRPIDAVFLLQRAADPSNWISRSQRADYRVLLPPLAGVTFEVSAPGYKTYYYSGGPDPLKRPPVRLESGPEMKLDIQLEPEETKPE
jgi:hypothetical protein